MIEQIIDDIVKAEAEAEEKIKLANAKAKEVEMSAELEYEANLKATQIKIKNDVKQIIDSAVSLAENQAKEFHEQKLTHSNKLIQDAKKRADKAIKFIEERFLLKYGNN